MEHSEKLLKDLEDEYKIEFTKFEKLKFEGIVESIIILVSEGIVDVFRLNEISDNLITKYKKIAEERAKER